MSEKFSEIIASKKLILVDFYAVWCRPCKMMSHILKEVKNDLGENITILKVDVDKNEKLALEYNVQGVPTLILFKEGAIKWKQSGVVDTNSLKQIIKNYIQTK